MQFGIGFFFRRWGYRQGNNLATSLACDNEVPCARITGLAHRDLPIIIGTTTESATVSNHKSSYLNLVHILSTNRGNCAPR